MMKKHKKGLLIVLVLIICVGFFGISWLKNRVYQPSTQAERIGTTAKSQNEAYVFPAANAVKGTLIFYPGAFVEPLSYSIWAKEVAKAGWCVYLLKVPFDLAVLAPKQGEKILKDDPKAPVYLGGHSLGGVIASRLAHQHPREIAGVIFLASYPDEKGKLKNTAALSITAENDQVLDQKSYQKNKKYLPKNTTFENIAGGNHAGFGSYGDQKGDGNASISNTVQQKEVARMIIQWLEHSPEKGEAQ